VKRRGFDREHQLTCGRELTLIRQFDLDNIRPLALEHGDRVVEDSLDFGIEVST
jgi:hypothetical protein